MLFINLNATHLEENNAKSLMLTEVLYKSCRKNLAQYQNKKDQLLIDIFTFSKPACGSVSSKGI